MIARVILEHKEMSAEVVISRVLKMEDISSDTLKENVLYHALFLSTLFGFCVVWVGVHIKSPLLGIVLSVAAVAIGLSATELSMRVRSKVPLVVLFNFFFAYWQYKGPWHYPTQREEILKFHQTWQRRGYIVTLFLAGNILWTFLKRDDARNQVHGLMFFLVLLLGVRVWKTVSRGNLLRKQEASNAADPQVVLEDSSLLCKPIVLDPSTASDTCPALTRGAGVFVAYPVTPAAWWFLYIIWNVSWVATAHSDSLTAVLHNTCGFIFCIASTIYVNSTSAEKRQPASLVNWAALMMVMRVYTLSAYIFWGVVAAHLKIDVAKWGYAPSEIRNEQFTGLVGVAIVFCIFENAREIAFIDRWYRKLVAAEHNDSHSSGERATTSTTYTSKTADTNNLADVTEKANGVV